MNFVLCKVLCIIIYFSQFNLVLLFSAFLRAFCNADSNPWNCHVLYIFPETFLVVLVWTLHFNITHTQRKYYSLSLQVWKSFIDLFTGPFWICTTLVFTTAIAGNLANYFSLAGKDYNWKYDFHKGEMQLYQKLKVLH